MEDELTAADEVKLRQELLHRKYPTVLLHFDNSGDLHVCSGPQERCLEVLDHWKTIQSIGGANLLLSFARVSLAGGIQSSPNPPDYDYWCRLPAWTLCEAAAIFLGLDPRWTNLGHIEWQTSAGLAVKYRDLLGSMCRSVEVEELRSLAHPSKFFAWARVYDIRLAPELESATNAILRSADKSESPKRLRTLYILLLVMAYDKYDYKPARNQNPTSTDLARLTDALGCPVGEDTIRHCLRDAKQYLDWAPSHNG
jgi:hypothetical protein